MKERKDTVVLIVDDEPDILELLSEEFDFAGFQTKSAASGNEAISIIEGEDVHIVVSDFKMPNGNGMAVLNAVNSMPEAKRPVFYFVSGEADVSIKDAIDAGAKDFFTKPFDLEDLIMRIGTDAGVDMSGGFQE